MSIRRRSRTRLGTRRAATSAPVGITTANLVLGSPTSSTGIRLSNWPYSVSSPAPGGSSFGLDFRVDGFVAAVSDYVHEPRLGFRFPSLSLKPPSEGRYDYIALVPLHFSRPERHGRNLPPSYPSSALRRGCPRAGHLRTRSRGVLALVRESQD